MNESADSDGEEADYSQMDQKKQDRDKTRRGRGDFKSDEDFSAYKESREANPKYAAPHTLKLHGLLFALAGWRLNTSCFSQGCVSVRRQSEGRPQAGRAGQEERR
jgi:hypothetical protein